MRTRPAPFWALVLLMLGGAGLVLGTAVGSQGWEVWWTAAQDPVMQQIVRDIRLPRSLGAWLGGALLGLAGAVAQGLFRNPLADPFLLGSASGASLGVALALAGLGVSPMAMGWALQLGLTGAAFSSRARRSSRGRRTRLSTFSLLLIGVMVRGLARFH